MDLQGSCKAGNFHLCCQAQKHHSDLQIFGDRFYTYKYPTSSFNILLISPSLVSSISLTFGGTKDPTPIFILPNFSSFLPFIIVSKGKLLVDLGGGGGYQ